MNDNLFPYQRLDVYRAAMAIAVLMHETRIGHSELRDQISRACISIANNLSEGLPNDAPGLRKRYFTTARNSLHELVAAVGVGVAIGAADLGQVAPDKSASAKAQVPYDQQPYRIRVTLEIDPSARVDARGRDRLVSASSTTTESAVPCRRTTPLTT